MNATEAPVLDILKIIGLELDHKRTICISFFILTFVEKNFFRDRLF